jgi:hypothetical protein
MTKFEVAENANSSDSRTASSSLSEAVQSNMTLEDIKTLLTKKAPADVCIRDQDGYIACGPIVGSPRPEQPGLVIILKPTEPLNPSFDNLPPIYEKPMWPDKPLDPQTGKFPPKYDHLRQSENLSPFTRPRSYNDPRLNGLE